MHSSLRLSAILFAAVAADEESSLLQEANLLEEKPAAKRKNAKPLAGLLESARGFLTNGVTPDVVTFTTQTLDALSDDIIPALRDEGSADSTWLATEHGRFAPALAELALANTAVHAWNGEYQSASDNHKGCRGVEGYSHHLNQYEACYSNKRPCEQELYRLWREWVSAETGLREIHTQIEDHFCEQDEHGNYIANGTLHEFRVASVPWMTSYTNQKGVCDAAEGAYDLQVPICDTKHSLLDSTSNTCDELQAEMESKACSHASAIEEALREFHTTWAALHASYQGITDLVYNQTQDRHQEYKTLAIVRCLLNRVHELNGRPCDESTGTVDDQMSTCEEEGESLDICSEAPEICPTYEPPPPTPAPCADRDSVTGSCLPAPQATPCSPAWMGAEMDILPAVPVAPFSEANPGCNDYPDCSPCDVVINVPSYPTWVEPPASFTLAHYRDMVHGGVTDAHTDYADQYSLWGATVDGCSSDNSNRDASRGDQSGQMIPLLVHGADEHAAVRCCSHDGSSCESDVQGVCHDFATFHDASAICRAANMRLCSQAEMGSGVCCGTGCWFNHYAVWISDGTGGTALDNSNRYAAGSFREGGHDFPSCAENMDTSGEWVVAKGGNQSPHPGQDVGSACFNEMFAACPVVRYTNPSMAGSPGIYARHTARAYGGDAYDLFTGTWRQQDNAFHTDFDIYPTVDDARAGTSPWTYCNFSDQPQPNHIGVGFPRDCGPTGYQPHIWFSQNRNAFFEVYVGSNCPVA